MSDETPDPGIEFAHGFITLLESGADIPDPREDVDNASLLARFPALAGVKVRDLTLEGPHGEVHARVYDPSDPLGIGFVWIHGGAFIAGDLDMPEAHWISLELASRGVSVLSVDYRKALNGIHHPVLNDEVHAAWVAVSTTASDIWSTTPTHIHIGGASAGGNLAAGVTQRVVAEGDVLPDSVICIYPVLHDVVPEPSAEAAAAVRTLRPDQRFTPGFMRVINGNYLGDGQPTSIPAFPGDAAVDGLPPVLLINAEADDLRPSGEAFAAQLRDAGVDVSLSYEPGTAHGYLNEPGHPGAMATWSAVHEWLTRA